MLLYDCQAPLVMKIAAIHDNTIITFAKLPLHAGVLNCPRCLGELKEKDLGDEDCRCSIFADESASSDIPQSLPSPYAIDELDDPRCHVVCTDRR
jgi:hypothetical protein